MAKNTKKYLSKKHKREYEAWARFLYKQYRKSKIKEELLKLEGTK